MTKKQEKSGKHKPMRGRASRKHSTDTPHYEAVERWRKKHNRKKKVLKRQEERAARSPQDQLKRLDKMGMRAVKERARLQKEIDEQK